MIVLRRRRFDHLGDMLLRGVLGVAVPLAAAAGLGFKQIARYHRGSRSLVLSSVRFAIDGPGFAGETPA